MFYESAGDCFEGKWDLREWRFICATKLTFERDDSSVLEILWSFMHFDRKIFHANEFRNGLKVGLWERNFNCTYCGWWLQCMELKVSPLIRLTEFPFCAFVGSRVVEWIVGLKPKPRLPPRNVYKRLETTFVTQCEKIFACVKLQCCDESWIKSRAVVDSRLRCG